MVQGLRAIVGRLNVIGCNGLSLGNLNYDRKNYNLVMWPGLGITLRTRRFLMLWPALPRVGRKTSDLVRV